MKKPEPITEHNKISALLEGQPIKDIYELGEIPPFGYVPEKMYAWALRRERHGEPDKARHGDAYYIAASPPFRSRACWRR